MLRLGSFLMAQGHEVQYFGMDDENRVVGNDANSYVSNIDFHNCSLVKKAIYLIKSIYSIEARHRIRPVINSFNPDVIHLNNINFQLTPSIMVEIIKWKKRTQSKCRIVYTAHDGQLICPNHQLRNPISKRVCKKCINGDFFFCVKNKCIHSSTMRSLVGTLEAYYWNWRGIYTHIDTIICCSSFFKDLFDNNMEFRKRTIMIQNFSDEHIEFGITKKDYVIYFGRYSEEKGLLTLIEVCKSLKSIRFIFAGSGPLECNLEGIKNITNVGYKSGSELKKLIREARFSICPSECYENCPFSVIESIKLGTPVIGANIGGIPELIDEGKTGELFESGNRDKLEEKIRIMWENRNKNDYLKGCLEVCFNSIESYVYELMKFYI